MFVRSKLLLGFHALELIENLKINLKKRNYFYLLTTDRVSLHID